jgi:hypothetical protein
MPSKSHAVNKFRSMVWIFPLLVLSTMDLRAQGGFLIYHAPGGYNRRVYFYPGDELSIRLKPDPEFYTGRLTGIRDTFFTMNQIPVFVSQISSIRLNDAKRPAILAKALGIGAQLYLGVRIINSLIQDTRPVVTWTELAINIPIIIGYYAFEFGVNRKKRVFKVNSRHRITCVPAMY